MRNFDQVPLGQTSEKFSGEVSEPIRQYIRAAHRERLSVWLETARETALRGRWNDDYGDWRLEGALYWSEVRPWRTLYVRAWNRVSRGPDGRARGIIGGRYIGLGDVELARRYVAEYEAKSLQLKADLCECEAARPRPTSWALLDADLV